MSPPNVKRRPVNRTAFKSSGGDRGNNQASTVVANATVNDARVAILQLPVELEQRLALLEAQLAQLADRHRATCVRLAALEEQVAEL